MFFWRTYKKEIAVTILVFYIVTVLCQTIVFREKRNKIECQTEWLKSYQNTESVFTDEQNLFNILLFVPIGCFVGLITSKYRLLMAGVIGLFISETIECSQLIWLKGVFDVDDLFNNVLGAFIGGVIVVLLFELKMLVRKKDSL